MSLQEIRCPSCLAVVGISRRPDATAVYCNDYCAEDYRISANEERDALIEHLAERGWSPTQIAMSEFEFDLTRQAVTKILERRIGVG